MKQQDTSGRKGRSTLSMMPRHWMILLLLFFPLALIQLSSGLTYDSNVEDLSEPATRHIKTKRKTRVAMEDLELDALDAAEAANLVMERIGESVSSDAFVFDIFAPSI